MAGCCSSLAKYLRWISGRRSGWEFIETEEREEPLAALASVMDEFELDLGRPLAAERLALLSGIEDARDW
jgi:hypothetical protein